MSKNFITETVNNLPELIKNTHININLQGWPAAISVMSCCAAYVSVKVISIAEQTKRLNINETTACAAY